MINFKDISFSEFSLVDSLGIVFTYKNKIFRAINHKDEDDCRKLLNSELFQKLTNMGLIPKTHISDLVFENYNLVLEHEKFVDSKPFEWSFSMLKAAAKTTLIIRKICNQYGYELKDAHPYNILFDGTVPKLIDIGSITLKQDTSKKWMACNEFASTFYIPLILWQKGELLISRLILENDNYNRVIPNQTIESSKLFYKTYKQITSFQLKLPYLNRNIKINKYIVNLFSFLCFITNSLYQIILRKKTSLFRLVHEIKEIEECEIDAIKKPIINSLWENYQNEYLLNTVNTTFRFEKILAIISKNCPDITSIIDLAGNKGFFSSLLHQTLGINEIIVADYDANAIDDAYSINNLDKNWSPNFVLMNFMVPVNLDSTSQRLKCDLAIALAVTHHLLLSQNFSIIAILDHIRRFSRKFVLIEFMPLGLWGGRDADPICIPEWYNLSWFRDNFKSFFELIYEEQVEKNRIVFVGKML